MIDLRDQILDAGEGASPDGLVGDQSEEAFNLIEPGAVGRDEMDVPARSAGQPSLDPRVLVSTLVVHDHVDVQVSRDVGFDAAQESQEFLMSVTRLALSEHYAVEYIEGRKQHRGAVALVVVSNALDIAKTQRQHRLRALDRLHLTFLIHTQHQGVFGWSQIQTHDIAPLFDEEGSLKLSLRWGLTLKSWR